MPVLRSKFPFVRVLIARYHSSSSDYARKVVSLFRPELEQGLRQLLLLLLLLTDVSIAYNTARAEMGQDGAPIVVETKKSAKK